MKISSQKSITLLASEIQTFPPINLAEAEKFQQMQNQNKSLSRTSQDKKEALKEMKKSKKVSKLKLKKKLVGTLLCIAPLVIVPLLMVA